MSEVKVLDVGIVGAGIAGLAAAIALRRGGHKVEVGGLIRVGHYVRYSN